MRRRPGPILQVALAALVTTSTALAGNTLDESTARAALTQNPDNVLAALVEVQSECHAEDPVCVDGVRVVQVYWHRDASGAGIKAGDSFSLNLGAGSAGDLAMIGQRVLFVGPAFVEKNGTRGFTARVRTVAPSPKDIDDLRSVIQSVQAKPGA
jgi:hypothetical protein